MGKLKIVLLIKKKFVFILLFLIVQNRDFFLFQHIYAIIEYENIDSANKCFEYSDEYKLNDGTCLKVKQRNQHEFKSKRMLISEEEFLNINKEKEIEQHGKMLEILNNQSTVENELKLN